MTGAFPVVQAIKTVATERMLTAAHHYQQLVGGEGYRCGSPTNIAAEAFLDTRVFTIFDGTNDLLSQQLAKHCRARAAGRPLSEFLDGWTQTAAGVAAHRLDLRFLDRPLGQEHLVLAGRAIAYTIVITLIRRWAAATGADPDTSRAATAFLEADIAGVAAEFDLLATGILADDRHPEPSTPVSIPAPSPAVTGR